jgi:uncharacterized protein (DUF952 family)
MITHPKADQIAYKVLTADEWAALKAGTFQGAPIDNADGFIHLSTASQLTETVDRHFSGRKDLAIAAIDLAELGDAVRWEPSRNGQLFPHVYGHLKPQSVIARIKVRCDEASIPNTAAARGGARRHRV